MGILWAHTGTIGCIVLTVCNLSSFALGLPNTITGKVRLLRILFWSCQSPFVLVGVYPLPHISKYYTNRIHCWKYRRTHASLSNAFRVEAGLLTCDQKWEIAPLMSSQSARFSNDDSTSVSSYEDYAYSW